MLSWIFRALRLGGVLTSPQATPLGLQMTPPSPGNRKSKKARLSRLYSYNQDALIREQWLLKQCILGDNITFYVLRLNSIHVHVCV